MGQPVERGQYMTSLSRLARDLNLSVRQVRTALTRLEKTGEIDTQTTNKSTLVTISNYGSYQIDESTKKKKTTRKRQAVDTQTTDINKKERKEEEKNNTTFYNTVRTESIWVTQVAMQYHAKIPKVLNALERFHNHLNITQDNKRTARDFKTHFVNWIKYNLEDSNQSFGNYQWKWKGQAMKTGNKEEYERDKAAFDKPGFDFQTLI
jgi:DNA-binding transcriptional regulator YhcF (GntR family)